MLIDSLLAVVQVMARMEASQEQFRIFLYSRTGNVKVRRAKRSDQKPFESFTIDVDLG